MAFPRYLYLIISVSIFRELPGADIVAVITSERISGNGSVVATNEVSGGLLDASNSVAANGESGTAHQPVDGASFSGFMTDIIRCLKVFISDTQSYTLSRTSAFQR
jgi:hypothetical protein